MKFDWVYLCSDPRRLELTLKFLPKIPGLDRMYVVFCSHFGQVTQGELEDVAFDHAPSWLHIFVEDLTGFKDMMPAGLQSYFRNDGPPGGDGRVKTLGVKLLLPLIFEPPLLYTDDDVLVLRDPVELYRRFGEYGNRGTFRLEGKKCDMLEDIAEAFGVPEHAEYPELFDAHIIGAGVWFIGARSNWASRLERFAKCSYVGKLKGTAREFFCLDQRFITAFGLEHGWKQIGLKEGFRRTFLAGNKLPRNFFHNATFVHYGCAPKDKAKWVGLLQAEAQQRQWAYGIGPGSLAGNDRDL